MLWTVVKEAAKNRSSHKDSRQGAALAFSLGPVIVIAIAVAAFFFGGRFCARMACPVR
jgi:membrane protein